jgi:hypothetical protein
MGREENERLGENDGARHLKESSEKWEESENRMGKNQTLNHWPLYRVERDHG